MKSNYLILIGLIAIVAAAVIVPSQAKSIGSKSDYNKIVRKTEPVKLEKINYYVHGFDPIDKYAERSRQYMMIMLFRNKLKDAKRIYVMDRLTIDNAYYNEYLFPGHQEGKTDLLCEGAWMEQNNIIASDTEQGREACNLWHRFVYDMTHGRNMDKNPTFVIVNAIKDWEEIFPNERKRW